MKTNYTRPKTLLSKGASNAKTAKNSLESYILYLAPHRQNSKGVNLCPAASQGCAAACLYTAGRGRFSNVQQARINRTEYYLEDREGFMLQLAGELVKINSKAKKTSDLVAIRLNGTSDIDFIYQLKKYAALDVFTLEQLIFYDYTKILGKVKKYAEQSRYFLTFSRAEDNEDQLAEALSLGANVSVVFNGPAPKIYAGAPVVDGDTSDLVMCYNRGAVLALKAKGEAKKDRSGFVVNTAVTI